ncbi:hypothetical protein HY409_04075 [Candidatus Gottesmanbacteria bacterium]|nr:hypothetical protein [Candidatus Gottesmanbacteria bacterium]
MTADRPEPQIVPLNPEYVSDQRHVLENIRVVPMETMSKPLLDAVRNPPKAGEITRATDNDGDTIQCTSFGEDIYAVQKYGRRGNVRGLPLEAQKISDYWLVDTRTQKAFRVNQLYENHPAVKDRGASCEMLYINGQLMNLFFRTNRGGALVLTHLSGLPQVHGQVIDEALRRHITVHDIFSPFHEADHAYWKLHDDKSKGSMKLRHMMLVKGLGSIAWSMPVIRKLLTMIPKVQTHLDTKRIEELAMEKSASMFALNLGDKLDALGVHLYRAASREKVEDTFAQLVASHDKQYDK